MKSPSRSVRSFLARRSSPLALVGLGVIAGGGLVGILATAVGLGPLNPPAGAVSPTNKTLAEIEPRVAINATNTPGDNDATPSLFKITQPGSYYLTGTITGVTGKHGIEIAADNVTIDLNGFTVQGVAGSLTGIITPAVGRGVTIVNGVVAGWGNSGIDLGNGIAGKCIDIVARNNTGYGLYAGHYGSLDRCLATDNTSTGFVVGSGCSVTSCAANTNAGGGYNTGYSTTLRGCSAIQNTGIGFSTFSGSVVVDCTAGFNTTHGFNVINGTQVSNCTALANGQDGIRATFGCTLLHNNCDQNATGIHIVNNQNRVEGNHVTNGTTGYAVDGTINIILRNTSTSNTNHWVIAANNTHGPIIDRRIPAPIASTPAVSGTAAASTLGSTDPNANFTY